MLGVGLKKGFVKITKRKVSLAMLKKKHST